MLRTSVAGLLVLVAIASTSAGRASEISERGNLMLNATGAIADRDYKKLAKLERDLWVSKARTISGTSLLAEFYRDTMYYVAEQHACATCIPYIQDTIRQWQLAAPDSAAAFLAEVNLLSVRAAQARGDGPVSTVSPEKMQLFINYSEQVDAALKANRKRLSWSPLWYTLAQSNALSLGMKRSSYEALLAEGVSKDPRYFSLYYYAVYYNLPQWYGSLDHLERLARYAVKSTASTDKTGLYARVYWVASEAFYRDKLFSDTNIDWPTMKRSMRDVSAQYPSDWNHMYFAKFACLAKDFAEAERYLKLITDPRSLPWTDAAGRASCGRWGYERDLARTP